MKRLLSLLLSLNIGLSSCNSTKQETINTDEDASQNAQVFIDDYTAQYLRLYYDLSKAQWQSNTHIEKDDTLNAYNTQKASEAFAAYVGSMKAIEQTQDFLQQKELLSPLQIKQLETILYAAANSPSVAEEAVKERIRAETAQIEKLFGFDFMIGDQAVTTNEIDHILKTETDLKVRQQVWETSKEVGKVLKDGLENLRQLRNETVKALGYNDYFSYQVSDYGMDTQEMMELNQKLIEEIWPLYRELHTYIRYHLADKYDEDVPDLIPAHWLPNRWAQDWSELVSLEAVNLDAVLEKKGNTWIIEQAERFYISLGFDSLPEDFYENSSLYPLPADALYKKNNHASAWHMDLGNDVRCLMSVEPNAEWYETTHHELGHIYYFMSYTSPDVPPLLRTGANRAFHEAVGSLMGLAAMQKPFLTNLGLIEESENSATNEEEMQILLKEALNFIVFIPFSAGVMTSFEHDLYVENLPKDKFNQRWWALAKKYQGIMPPSTRGEEYCDAASKTHINDDPAQYYDYAISNVLLFQMHDHIANKILKTDPRNTNYYDNKEIGKFLSEILSPGATIDWRQLLKESIGSELSANAMLDYFQPLMSYLKQINKGRNYTLPERPAK